MSENGEIYTAGNKFYTPAGTDGMDKFHLWVRATELTGQKEEKKKKEEEKKENCCRRDRTGGRHRSLYKRASWT